MKILATYNIKGGVGKTATAVNLGYLAARDGYRVLLWDLDPQAATSFLFRIRPRVKGGGKALIRGTRTIDDAIKATDFDRLDLLPADFTYRNLDLVLDAAKKPAPSWRRPWPSSRRACRGWPPAARPCWAGWRGSTASTSCRCAGTPGHPASYQASSGFGSGSPARSRASAHSSV